MCVLPQWRVRPILRPGDYERWFWRDETTAARRRRMARTIVEPRCRQRDAAHVDEGWARRERGAAESGLRGSRRNDRRDGAGRTAGSAPCAGRPACSNRSPAPAGESTGRGPTGRGVPPVPLRSDRCRRAVGAVGVVEAGTNTSATVAMHVTALPPPFEVPLHWLMVTGRRRISARHGATRGRLSGIGATAVRRTVALRDSRICGAAKGGACLRARWRPTRRTDSP